MVTKATPAKAALQRAEASTKKAVKEVKKAEAVLAKTSTKAPVKAAAKPAQVVRTTTAPKKVEQAVKKMGVTDRNFKPHSVTIVTAAKKPAPKTPEPKPSQRPVKASTPKAAAKAPVKATTAVAPQTKIGARVTKRSGPQVKTATFVKTVPIANATSEAAAEQVITREPLVAAVSHQLDRRSLMSDLTGSTRATTTAAPVPPASVVQGATSEKVAVVPNSGPQQKEEIKPFAAERVESMSGALKAHDSLREAHSILRPHTSAPPVSQPYQPRTEWRGTPLPTPASGKTAATAPTGLQRNFDVPRGIGALSTSGQSAPAAPAVPPRAPDGYPATSENTRAETPPQQAVWKSALAGAPAWPRSNTAGGAQQRSSAPPPPPSTGQAPGLIERRFEVYQEGLSAWRWRLMDAGTGRQIAQSQTPYGTPGEAEQSANDESRLYRLGTSLVVRASGGAR